MKIQLLSDLHLECEAFNIHHAEADVVVLAGDIHTGLNGIEWAKKHIKNKPVIYVMGNHEYYHSAYPALLQEAKVLTKGSHIHLLENDSVQIGTVNFYGLTLWTNFELFGVRETAYLQCQQSVPDYHKITLSPQDTPIRPEDTAAIHQQSIEWLETAYDHSGENTNVIISHHAPSARSVPEQYTNALTSASYASHLDALIETLSPRLWLHGHMHESCDYRIGSTRVVCNPKGYADENSQGFEANRLIVID